MANVTLITGGESAFNTAVYGAPSEDDSLFQRGYEKAKSLLRDTGSAYLQEAKNLYDSYNGSEAINRAKRLLRGLKGIGREDVGIYYLTEAEIYKAKVGMRRYILAQHRLNALYQQQSCDGWSSEYQPLNDYQGDPRENPDYLVVMNGVDKDDQDMTFFDGDEDLDTLEQLDILDTWQNVDNIMDDGNDPTDIHKGRL